MSDEFLELLKKLGQNIRTLRESKGLSLDELAKLAVIRKCYLVRIENAEAPRAKITQIERIATVLEVRLSELLK